MHEINITLSGLVENQYHIQNTINQLSNVTLKYDIHYKKRLYLDAIYLDITNNIELLSKFLSNLENILAFTKLGICHHEVVTATNIKAMIDSLELVYNKDRLVPLKSSDIREYYNIIRTGSYFKGNTVVVVLKIPILLPSIYTLYKLFPIPTIHQTILIPRKPFLAMNDNTYSYLENVSTYLR